MITLNIPASSNVIHHMSIFSIKIFMQGGFFLKHTYIQMGIEEKFSIANSRDVLKKAIAGGRV